MVTGQPDLDGVSSPRRSASEKNLLLSLGGAYMLHSFVPNFLAMSFTCIPSAATGVCGRCGALGPGLQDPQRVRPLQSLLSEGGNGRGSEEY